MRPLLIKAGALVVALSVAVAVVACGRASQGPTPTPEPTPTPTATPTPTPTPTPVNPRALLDRSGQVMASLDSFHFRLEHRRGATSLLPGLAIEEAEGDVVRPDRLSVQFSGSLGNMAVRSGLVTIGDASYMTNPLTGKWEQVQAEVSPLAFFNPSAGIAAIMARVEPLGLEEATVGGRRAYRLTGRLAAEALARLLGATLRGATVDVTLVIDARELYLLEALLEGKASPLDQEDVARVITLSRFNEPIDIRPPE